MNLWDGKTINILRRLVNMLLLNLLWLVCCIPVVTIGAATLAMHGVIRNWILFEDQSVIRNFMKELRKHGKQAMTLGVGWTIVGGILIFDLIYFLHIPSNMKIAILPVICFALVLYFMISAYLFIMIVYLQCSGWTALRNAFVYAFLDIKTTMAILLMMGVIILLFFLSSFTLLLSIAPIVWITHKFALLSFQKNEQLQNKIAILS